MESTKQFEASDHEFKCEFTGTAREWVEIVKDIVAMANSGGGRIYFGLDDNGEPSKGMVIKLDSATIVDKINRYTGEQLNNLKLSQQIMNGSQIVILEVGHSECPLIFTSPGTYEACPIKKNQHTAFARGTIYFRHGAKSEHGTCNDLRLWGAQVAKEAVASLKENLRQVVELPPGQKAKLTPIVVDSEASEKIRITDDPDATVARVVDPYTTHPYRQMDLVNQFNSRMKDKIKISSHDVQCIKKAHSIDKRSDFYYKPPIKNASAVYSDLFLNWLIGQFNDDVKFFEKARKIAFPNGSATVKKIVLIDDASPPAQAEA